MAYMLEHKEEFNRLEKQSNSPGYDYQQELQNIVLKDGASILDAGCGTGIVSRYLARRFPSARVVACDFTLSLLEQAREAAKDISNLSFEEQDLKQLTFTSEQFDLIISRFVIHHQNTENRSKLIAEMVRVLKPGGTLVVIDIDGATMNLYPQTPAVAEGLQKWAAYPDHDCFVGRKLPSLLLEAGLMSVSWRIETVAWSGTDNQEQWEMMRTIFQNASAIYAKVLGGKEKQERFVKEYLECMKLPQSVYFFNKFIVSAIKPE